MPDKQSPFHEHPSEGRFGAVYYADALERVPHESVPASCGLTGFRVLDSTAVREPTSGNTVAYEITLQILDNPQATAEMQPGVVFAFEPKNHRNVVDVVLLRLKHEGMGQEAGQALPLSKLLRVAQQEVEVPVKSSYIQSQTTQRLTKREVLAGVVDVSRPTPQLVNLLLQRAGNPQTPYTAEEMAASFSVEQLLKAYPGYITLEELCANQPPINTRPYTISDIDREAGTLKIVVSDVEVDIPPVTPDAEPTRKRHGTATRMLLDLVEGNDHEYILNGYLANHGPKLFFPDVTRFTGCMESYLSKTEHPYWQQAWERFSDWQDDEGKTLYLLGTGSGIAPYMALLRELERREERGEEPYPHKIVLINGGRGIEGELFAEEIAHFQEKGILDDYRYVDSTPDADGRKTYIQDVLKQEYGKEVSGLLDNKKALVYVCGTKAAKEGVAVALTEIAGLQDEPEKAKDFIDVLEQRFQFQSTSSEPGRFFTLWAAQNEATHHREPKPTWMKALGKEPVKSPEEPWTTRILNIVPPCQGAEAQR